MDKPELFQIGTVAKLFHLSVSSLRHYEDIGLLKPEYVSPESGYRYYSARQFEVLSSIRYLRALDLPLPEIADFLKNKDVDRIEEKLRQQKQAVIERQQALQRVERRIDNRLRQLESAQHARLDEITLTRAPACRLCWIQSSLKIRSSLDMEPPIRRLEETQKDAVVFLGKVGLGITPGHTTSTTGFSSCLTRRTSSPARSRICRRRTACACASAGAIRRPPRSTAA